MKNHYRTRSRRRPFPRYVARQGDSHASQALAAVLAEIYHALLMQDPELAEQCRHDPLGLKTGMAS